MEKSEPELTRVRLLRRCCIEVLIGITVVPLLVVCRGGWRRFPCTQLVTQRFGDDAIALLSGLLSPQAILLAVRDYRNGIRGHSA